MIYFKYLKMLLKSQMQYRASFWLTMTGQFFVSFFAFIGIFLLFERFGNIRGWSFAEVCLCFAVTQTAFALSECFARGFDLFSHLIKSGDFDRVMIRPRGTLVQVLGSDFELSRIGRLLQSLVVLGLSVSWLPYPITFLKGVTIFLMVLSGTVIFSGVFILGATICFFTTEGLEVVNVFTDGGREFAAYPMDIYNKWVARFFSCILPYACFNYLPLMFIVGRAGPTYALMPLLGMLFIFPCLWAWNAGVKRYLSTGS